MKLHEKSFLEPKLLESLNLSFRVQTDLNMILDSNNTLKNNSTITIPSSRAKILSAKRSLVTLKQIANEPKIWKSVQKYIGYKFLLGEVLMRMPDISMKMSNINPVRDRFLSESFSVESVVDIEAYKLDYKQLQKETQELEATRLALQKEVTRCQSFFSSAFNVDHTRLVYLTTKVNYARHAGFPSRVKSTKNEYLTKLSELRKSMKQAVVRRSEEVDEDLLFLRTLNGDTQRESQAFFQAVDRAEQQHWRETIQSHDHLNLRVQSASELDPESIERRTQDVLDRATQRVDEARQAMTRSQPVSHLVPSIVNSVDNKPTSYLSTQLKQLDLQSQPLLQGYSAELGATMERCLNRAEEAVHRKHGPFDEVVQTNASLANVAARIEELRAATESFARQQETLRERLFDRHEEDVGRARAAILQRRILFLNRIKDKFDTLQAMRDTTPKTNRPQSVQNGQRPPPPPPPSSSGRNASIARGFK